MVVFSSLDPIITVYVMISKAIISRNIFRKYRKLFHTFHEIIRIVDECSFNLEYLKLKTYYDIDEFYKSFN